MRVSRGQLIARLIVLVAPLAVVLTGDWASSGRAPVALIMIVVALAALAAVFPDSNSALVLIVVLSVYWSGITDEVTSPASLAAAVLLLAFHAATALAASGPAPMAIDATTVLRWLRRVGAVTGVTAAVWGLVWVVSTGRGDANLPATVAAFALTALLGWHLHRSSRSV